MSPEKLKRKFNNLNKELYLQDLLFQTFGNVISINKGRNIVLLKHEGIPYKELKIDDIIFADLNYQAVNGCVRPPRYTKTYLILYHALKNLLLHNHYHRKYPPKLNHGQKIYPFLEHYNEYNNKSKTL